MITGNIKQTNNTLLEIAQNTSVQPTSSDRNYYTLSSNLETQPGEDYPPQRPHDEKHDGAQHPKAVIVNPTSEQNENYEVLKAQLDDPSFLLRLSLPEFASREDLKSLPEPMQRILLNKAVDQFNRGYISKDVFLGRNNTVNP